MELIKANIIITGAGGSFGQYLCKYFADKCARIFAIDINSVAMESLVANNISKYQCDLTDNKQVAEVIESIKSHADISVLINNAGYIHSEPLVNLLNKEKPTHSVENWNKTLQLNLTTCFNISSQVALSMIQKRAKGLIINISSISAAGNAGQSAYAAAKAGVEALTKTWSKELGPFKIRTACVAPGFIESNSTSNSISESVVERLKKQIPLNKFGELEHVALCIEMIILNDYINGKVIPVDGGLTL